MKCNLIIVSYVYGTVMLMNQSNCVQLYILVGMPFGPTFGGDGFSRRAWYRFWSNHCCGRGELGSRLQISALL
jgi:hypothetical protein